MGAQSKTPSRQYRQEKLRHGGMKVVLVSVCGQGRVRKVWEKNQAV